MVPFNILFASHAVAGLHVGLLVSALPQPLRPPSFGLMEPTA